MWKLLATCILVSVVGAADRRNIVEYLSSNSQYSTLVSLVKTAGLVDTLTNIRFATIFAPNNDAFNKIPAATLNELKADKKKLTNVLLNHLTNFTIISPTIQNNDRYTNLYGGSLVFNINNSKVTVNGVEIIDTDAIVSNGVVHTVSRVLLPAEGDIPTYLAIHDDQFMDLFAVIVVARLEDALRNGVFTLFAPNDAAFSTAFGKLPQDTTALQDLLKYHVVAGSIYSSNLSDGQVLKTLNGRNLSVSVSNNVVKINGATVVTADINTNNGVIHAVDGVLFPPTK